MNSFFSSRVSKFNFNILMAFSTFSICVFSIPMSAYPQEVCIKTALSQVVCGKPVEKPSFKSNQADSSENHHKSEPSRPSNQNTSSPCQRTARPRYLCILDEG